jgi:3-oxoacyl-[acyl-carrier protein] reductase
MAVAKLFAGAGVARIALLDNDSSLLDKSVAALRALGRPQVIRILVDLSDKKALHAAIDQLFQTESDHWDILITTAGLFIGTPLITSKLEDVERLLQINSLAVLEVSKLLAKGMISRKYGKIIHIGSSSTWYGTPGSGIYAASKTVVNQLTQTMAVEWGPHNIQVNAVCPTVAETKFLNFVKGDVLHEKLREKLKERMPLKRLLKAEDIAPLVVFLASDEAQFINGAIIPVDGGSRLVST